MFSHGEAISFSLPQALALLREAPERNVLLAGDLNWNDKEDGVLPLTAGWCMLLTHRLSPRLLGPF